MFTNTKTIRECQDQNSRCILSQEQYTCVKIQTCDFYVRITITKTKTFDIFCYKNNKCMLRSNFTMFTNAKAICDIQYLTVYDTI